MSFKRTSRGGNRGRGNGRAFGGRRGGGGRGRKIKMFDPSMLVKKAVAREPEEVYVADHNFSDFRMASELKENVFKKGYTHPTPIQDQAIPALLEGRDVVGIANTGTGKTAAFLLPLINAVFRDRNKRVLILAPTRELAIQIDEEFRGFVRGLGIRACVCIGGTSINRQGAMLRENPEFVIGTPGRLKDLEQRGLIRFRRFNTVVLDEVDRMMDMGFIHDMRHIISRMPVERHSVFFSATLPDAVRKLIGDFSDNPVMVEVKSAPTSENVDQDVVKLQGRAKVEVLHELLIQDGYEKVLVFGRTKYGVDKLSKALNQRGFRTEAIHGNKSQPQRQRALRKFRRSEVQILLATDVASRGLDIDDVTHVINFDLPESMEDYVHRIGRTGRGSKKGFALSFVD